MAVIRVEPEYVAKKRAQIGELKAYIARMQVLNSLRLSEFWPSYKGHLHIIAGQADVEIKNVLAKEKDVEMAGDYGTMKKLLGRIQVAEAMILEVEGASARIDDARERIVALEAEIKDAEERVEHVQAA